MFQLNTMMIALRQRVDDGTLTIARYIENETFVCFTERLPNGLVNYHQALFDNLSQELQEAFKGHTLGHKVGVLKIVGIWDAWAKEDVGGTPMGKIRVSQ